MNIHSDRTKTSRKAEISDKEILKFVVNFVMPLFAFAFNGGFSLKDMVRVIVYACSERITIEQATKRLKNAPKAANIRYHLRNKLDLEYLEKKLS